MSTSMPLREIASNAPRKRARSSSTEARRGLSEAKQVGEARGAERAQRRHHVDGLEQVGLALPVVAMEDVETWLRLEDERLEVPHAAHVEREDPHRSDTHRHDDAEVLV